MGILKFIRNIIEQYWDKRQTKRDDACHQLICRIDDALYDAKSIIESRHFVEPQTEVAWRNRNKDILCDAATDKIQHLKKAVRYEELLSRQIELANIAYTFSEQILQHNEQTIKEAYSLVKHVEGRTLDQQQMTCIVKEPHNHLVIAGAGTGKTTTIVGKIKYLLKTKQYSSQDFLVLSFTNASASEMAERIFAETGHHITASTFHKFGLNIIAQVNGVMPRITHINLREFIKGQLLHYMEDDSYLSLLNFYWLYNRVPTESEFKFKTKKEYQAYLKLHPPTTINNELVKSYGEMDIANFLAQNGIRYIYEHPYESDTRTSKHGQYHPDFYLPDYKIYIEYFGINRNGEVPPYFKAEHGKTATEIYRASMEWKRTVHRVNHTIMIECYAYEKLEGNLLEELKKKLKAASISLAPKSPKEIWEKIAAGDFFLYGLIKLFETLINLIKSNNYDIASVRTMNQSVENNKTNTILLSLLEPIFNSYCQYLSDHKEIDFNDMINLAAEYVRQGKYINPYKYVIVDEYQDISKAYFTLLDCLRKSKDYELFCVGDDWQSIYRFAGSDIGFILNFSKYWGESEISKIETTYRFSQKLIEISGGFIMKNPAQIKKSIRGRVDKLNSPLEEISGYTDQYAIELASKKLKDLPKGSSVFFIGRYAFDCALLNNSNKFFCQFNNTSGFIDVTALSRPDLHMQFLTAHKSKGLQADYVFIINNKRARLGFPSRIQDAPILDLLLENCDQYPYAEERRLFYVALTRAKKKTFIVTVKGKESEFVMELKALNSEEVKK